MCKLPIRVSSILTLLFSIAVYIPAYQFPKYSHGFSMPDEDEVRRRRNSVVLGAFAPFRGLSPPTSHFAWLTMRHTVAEYFRDEEGQDAAAHG